MELGKMSGTLYGLGLGPGDPDLLTRKAARLISEAQVVAYPALAGSPSFARQIAAQFIPPDAMEITMDIPMTVERAPAQKAYDKNAGDIRAHLVEGRDVVVLCEGDPLFFGSFMYLYARLRDEFPTEIVPGVTSITACAATAGLPLAARNERVTILPAPNDDAALAEGLAHADTLILMKVGRHLSRVRDAITKSGRLDQAVYIERASTPKERVLPLADAPEVAPYFSMILVVKGADPWL